MDALLEPFRSLSAAFTIENAEDLGRYGLDEPTCTITLTTDDKTYTVKLGDHSTMDSQRYMDIGDGNVYLAASDPLDAYDVELKDLIANDDVPYFDEVSHTGRSLWQAAATMDALLTSRKSGLAGLGGVV